MLQIPVKKKKGVFNVFDSHLQSFCIPFVSTNFYRKKGLQSIFSICKSEAKNAFSGIIWTWNLLMSDNLQRTGIRNDDVAPGRQKQLFLWTREKIKSTEGVVTSLKTWNNLQVDLSLCLNPGQIKKSAFINTLFL